MIPTPQLASILESLLFVHGEPISLEKLAQTTKVGKAEVASALEELKNRLAPSGLVLLEANNEYQLGSKQENGPYIEDFIKSELSEELSRAGLEVTTIVAYKGPLTRAEIEYLRGVNSTFTLRNLLMRGLVERIENPKDARSYLYRVSFDFLKHLGIARVEDLPRYGEFRKEKIDILEEPHK